MRISTLELRFDPDPERPDRPNVTILVDGADYGADGDAAGLMGFAPADILGPGAPLLPADPPRRVAVYRCACGEAGCDCVAPVIARDGAHVTWTDARTFTGVYLRPTVEPNPTGGRHLGILDVRFGAAQYEAEVARATTSHVGTSHPTARRDG